MKQLLVDFMLCFSFDRPVTDNCPILVLNKKRYDSELPYQRPDLIEVMEIDGVLYLLDFFCSGIQFNLLLSPYPCFISLLYLDLYVLGDDALIS